MRSVRQLADSESDEECLTRGKLFEPTPEARMVLYLVIRPGATLPWTVRQDAELRVQGARVWLTRAGSAYDYWLSPWESIRLRRGERIWISSDARTPAHVSLTSRYSAFSVAAKLGAYRRVWSLGLRRLMRALIG